ncbi:CRISPR-associated helicase/endonuclease Cas3 [Actinosynnema sp. CS-041913]|uniref:CRISPR-associated helicase/endonuclease Cas3 n=1 Tax=Actinosynnema sp. CS-041913 TaxID=3239917 RepID=UPI003D8E7EAC
MGIRLVFSALVDADHLDTAAHHHGWVRPGVLPPADMTALVRRFEANRARLLDGRGVPSGVDVVRTRVYEDAVRLAKGGPGVYRLPAPTGSGKTMTAAGFALHHAAEHGRARVVVAVPFTTITGQNAAVYRELLGEQAVLEHHSNAELDDRRVRLAAENWDAPFVVTTTVQLFDSLFGRKPARSRKVHRLVNAVVVLDEVQSLPIPLLVPILDVLRTLAAHFRTTVLLASATQPSFEHLRVWRELDITSLVDSPVESFTRLRRVRYEWKVDPRPMLDAIAQQCGAATAGVGDRQHRRSRPSTVPVGRAPASGRRASADGALPRRTAGRECRSVGGALYATPTFVGCEKSAPVPGTQRVKDLSSLLREHGDVVTAIDPFEAFPFGLVPSPEGWLGWLALRSASVAKFASPRSAQRP